MEAVLGLVLAGAGVVATIWAGWWATRGKRTTIKVDLSQAIALPPAADDPVDFYSVTVRNTGQTAVTFPVWCAQLRIKGWKKGFTFVPRLDTLDTFVGSVYGPFSDVRFPYTLEPSRSFNVLVSRKGFDQLIGEKGKTGSVKVEAVVTDDIKRTFVSRPLNSSIAAKSQ